MKKIIFKVLFILGMNLCFAQNLKIATIAPSNSVWDTEAKKLAQDISRVTNGRVKLQFINATPMGGESGVIQKLNSVRPGQKAPIDGTIFTNLGIAELAPDLNILTLCVPCLFRNQEEIDLVYNKFKSKFEKEISKKGYTFLGTFNIGWAYFYTKKPVYKLDDLKVQKLNVGGLGLTALSDAFKAAGFRTEDVAANKLLQSMKTPGGVEGFYTIPLYAYAGQYYKALPYILNVPICPVIATFTINEKTWNSFSEADQNAILEAIKQAEKRFVEEQKNADQEYLNLCVQGGCTLITPTEEEYKIMEERLYNDADAMATTGLMDMKFFEEIKAVLKEYRGE